MLTESSFKDGASSAPFAESSPRPRIDSRLRPELTKWDALPRASGKANVDHPVVQISPPDLVRRRAMTWHGVTAESVQRTKWDKVEYRFNAPAHLLVAYEKGERWAAKHSSRAGPSMSAGASRPLNSYPTTPKIKVNICRQNGVLTILARDDRPIG